MVAYNNSEQGKWWLVRVGDLSDILNIAWLQLC